MEIIQRCLVANYRLMRGAEIMYNYSNVRVNPIDGSNTPRTLQEILTIKELDNLPGVYGIQLRDSVVESTIVVTETATGGRTFVEVSNAPLVGQFAIQYRDGVNPRGLLLFDVADDGVEVVIDYDGLGTVASAENIAELSYAAALQATNPRAHAAGTANAITATFTPAITNLSDGDVVSVRALYDNTSESVTFKPDSIAAKPVVLNNGNLVNTNIRKDSWLTLQYDATPDAWKILNPTSDRMIVGGSATFTKSSNNIELTNIVSMLGLELGDVIRISGSAKAENNKLFAVESITDDDNIVVNYEHRNGGGGLSLENDTSPVTIELIAKWFNASLTIGRYPRLWAGLSGGRTHSTTYTNTTAREMLIAVRCAAGNPYGDFFINVDYARVAFCNVSFGFTAYITAVVPAGSTYLYGYSSSFYSDGSWVFVEYR